MELMHPCGHGKGAVELFAESSGPVETPPWASTAISPIAQLKARFVRSHMGSSTTSRLMHFWRFC